MKTIPRLLPPLLALALLAGCDATTQTTSGARYLERYPNPAPMGPAATATPAGSYAAKLDARVREAAAIEPTLRLPARIGLARIANGALGPIPVAEGEAWRSLRADLGDSFGQFIPLDLLVTALVSDDLPRARDPDDAAVRLRDTIARIRIGAARQHLDAVLIYEVADQREITETRSIFLDLTLLGTLVDTRRSHLQVHARGLLIDVRNGYPYLSALASAENRKATSGFGSEERLRRQRVDTTTDAVTQLTRELAKSFPRLARQLPGESPEVPAAPTS